MQDLLDQLLSSLKAIWRNKWYGVVAAWIIALAGWFFVYQMPNRYEAYTRVHVDTDSILKPLMTGLAVQPDQSKKILMLSRTLVNRPNMEKLIRMTDLDVGLRTDVERTRLITRLSSELAINRAFGQEDLYTISYMHKDPEVAHRVVDSLLKLFVDSNRVRDGQDSDNAQRFIETQLEGYRTKLEEAEDAITSFRRRNVGLMPGEGLGYFARLEETKLALRDAELQLDETEKATNSIKQRLALESQNVPLQGEDGKVTDSTPETELDARIRVLEQKLDDLRLQYTEQHPDIVAIVPMIAVLKGRKEVELRQLRAKREADAKRRGITLTNVQANNPIYEKLAVSLTAEEAKLAAIKARVAEYRRRYAGLQASANAIPQVEAEFTQLTRDYDANKARYSELLLRREKAEITENLEDTNVSVGFRVIDPPRVPSEPSSPDRLVLMTLVLLAALGGGAGAAFGISLLRPGIKNERELEGMSGLPVLGTITMAWTDAQKKRQKWGVAAFLTSVASLLSAYAAIMVTLVLTMSRA